MQNIAIDDKILETLKLFGQPQEVVKKASLRYLVEMISEKIESLTEQLKVWEGKYGEAFESFAQKVRADEDFVRKLHQTNPTWEADLFEWEFYHEEIKDWIQRLQDILIR